MGMVLPMNYAEIEQEEMMYLDGGAIPKKRVWGISITMSAAESRSVQYYLGQAQVLGYGIGTIAGGLAAILAITTAGLGSIIAGSVGIMGVTVGVYAHLMKNSLAHHTTSRGVVLNISKVAVFWSKGR